jgi:hypothetical protein
VGRLAVGLVAGQRAGRRRVDPGGLDPAGLGAVRRPAARLAWGTRTRSPETGSVRAGSAAARGAGGRPRALRRRGGDAPPWRRGRPGRDGRHRAGPRPPTSRASRRRRGSAAVASSGRSSRWAERGSAAGRTGPSTNSARGTVTTAVVPAPGVGWSTTPTPWRAASRATTWNPRRWCTARSTSGGAASSALVSARSSAAIPTPQSSMTTTCPTASSRPGRDRTVTEVSGGEKRTAFSVSSARRWVRSVTTCPTTAGRSSTSMTTRVRSSVSATAARTTSRSPTGSLHVRGGCSPDRTSRFSALRRTRVVRWSRRNSSPSTSGSCSVSSSWLMICIWRCSMLWLRRARFTSSSRRSAAARSRPPRAPAPGRL